MRLQCLACDRMDADADADAVCDADIVDAVVVVADAP